MDHTRDLEGVSQGIVSEYTITITCLATPGRQTISPDVVVLR